MEFPLENMMFWLIKLQIRLNVHPNLSWMGSYIRDYRSHAAFRCCPAPPPCPSVRTKSPKKSNPDFSGDFLSVCLSLISRFRFSVLSSSIAQLLGQNGSGSKGKKRLYCLILICLSELTGRFRFSVLHEHILFIIIRYSYIL
jgi:hypothetical protein